jgi:hypothetical protein
MDAFLYFYLPFTITGLILFGLVAILRATERTHPKIKHISASSIISFSLVLMAMILRCYAPYKGWLDYLYDAFVIGSYFPFLITLRAVRILYKGVNFEDTIWQCVVFVVSFVLYTLLIFLVIRIVLSLKKKFGSGNALANSK